MVEFHPFIFIGSSNKGREQWIRIRNKMWSPWQVEFLRGVCSVAGTGETQGKELRAASRSRGCRSVDSQQDKGDLSPTTTRTWGSLAEIILVEALDDISSWHLGFSLGRPWAGDPAKLCQTPDPWTWWDNAPVFKFVAVSLLHSNRKWIQLCSGFLWN